MGQAAATDGAGQEVDAGEAEDDAHIVGGVAVGMLGARDGQGSGVRVVGARLQESPRGLELGVHVARREQAVVADADETGRQDVKQEATQEGLDRQGRALGVARHERHAVSGLIERDEALVADGDPMRVAPQVRVHLLHVPKGRFAVHDSTLGCGAVEVALEVGPADVELVTPRERAQTGEKLSTEERAEDAHRKEQARARHRPGAIALQPPHP